MHPLHTSPSSRSLRSLACLIALTGAVGLSVAATADDPKVPNPPKASPKTGPATAPPSDPHATPAAPAVKSDKKATKPAAPTAPAAEPDHGTAAPPAKEAEAPAAPAAAHHDDVPSVDADTALRRLVEGNARYVHDLDNTTPRNLARRAELAKGQHPFAIVLTCADSRVPPEMVFDQDLGDLFVVRLAGNTADEAGVGSMEYAVDHLGPKLIVVMGHTSCGAVKAAVETIEAGKDAASLPGHLAAIVGPIMPAVADTLKDGKQADAVKGAVIRNVQRTVASLRECGPILKEAVEKDGVRIVGAVYDLASGEIDFVPDLSPNSKTNSNAAASAGESGKDNAEH